VRAVDHPLVEIIGVAGSGKSSLARRLCEQPGFRPGGFIHARIPSHLLNIAACVPELFPIFMPTGLRRPQMSWREFKLMVYASRWNGILRRDSERNGGTTVLDQGPIYSLVRLQAEGKPFTRTPAFHRWWKLTWEAWAGDLRTIVWLDAPDDVLLGRINRRAQLHAAKGEDAEAGYRFLSTYRRSFESVLQQMEARGAPEVLRFDTGQTTVDALAGTIRPLLMADARP
jgi:thymidylate kinase